MLTSIWIIDEQDNYRLGIKKLLEIKMPNVSIKTFPSINKELYNNDNLPELILIEPFFHYSQSLNAIEFFNDRTKVAILSIENDRKRILELLSKDIYGFLSKEMRTEKLILAISQMLSGIKYIDEYAGMILFEEYKKLLYDDCIKCNI